MVHFKNDVENKIKKTFTRERFDKNDLKKMFPNYNINDEETKKVNNALRRLNKKGKLKIANTDSGFKYELL